MNFEITGSIHIATCQDTCHQAVHSVSFIREIIALVHNLLPFTIHYEVLTLSQNQLRKIKKKKKRARNVVLTLADSTVHAIAKTKWLP